MPKNRVTRLAPGSWKLLMSGSDLRRLYNVEEDPGESTDLSSEQAPLVEEMKKAFDHWSKDKVEPREGSRKVRTRFNGDAIEWHV